MVTAAVITADIVNSTKLGKAEEKKLLSFLASLFQDHKLEFYRGDSFQVYLKDPKDAYRLALQARIAALKLQPAASSPLFDVRASIGIGPVNQPVRSLKTASGEAFILSGRSFDDLTPDQRLVIHCSQGRSAIDEGLKLIAQFTDYLLRHLTARQAAVVAELLLGYTQLDTARRLKKSQSTIHKHTQSAGWQEITRLLDSYETFINLIHS